MQSQSEGQFTTDINTRAEWHIELTYLRRARIDLDLNGLGAEGLRPLHVALHFGRADCLEFLLAEGADPEARIESTDADLNGQTTWQFCLLRVGYLPTIKERDTIREILEFHKLKINYPDQVITFFEGNNWGSRRWIRDTEYAHFDIRPYHHRTSRIKWIHVHATNVGIYESLLYHLIWR